MEIADALDQWPGEPLIVVFFLALEQPLALPAGTTYEFMRNEPADWIERTGGKNFVGLRIHRVEETMDLYVDKDRLAFDLAAHITGHAHDQPKESEHRSNPFAPQDTILATIVEAATVLLPDADGSPRLAVSDAFDRCLAELRRLMIAYVKVTDDVRFRPISRHTCRMIVPHAFVRSDDSWTRMGMFTANHGTATLPFPPEELGPEGLHALEVSLLRATGADPSGLSVERNRAALRAYAVDGDYTSSVVLSYTSCEVFLNGILLLMAWEEGKTRDETRNWFEGKQGFMARISTHISPRLGGNCSSQKSDSPMSQLKRLADVRHQVVHLGYSASEYEAKAALEATKAIEDLTKSRLAERRNRFPRTALMVLGEPGLRRHGVPQKWIHDFMTTTGGHEPFWWGTYKSWLYPSATNKPNSD